MTNGPLVKVGREADFLTVSRLVLVRGIGVVKSFWKN
jgi:hypothetical protein